jgi:hypothetical protein
MGHSFFKATDSYNTHILIVIQGTEYTIIELTRRFLRQPDAVRICGLAHSKGLQVF